MDGRCGRTDDNANRSQCGLTGTRRLGNLPECPEFGTVARRRRTKIGWRSQRAGDETMKPKLELREFGTGRLFRPATAEEVSESREAAKWDGGCGVIAVPIDGRLRTCLVLRPQQWTNRERRPA